MDTKKILLFMGSILLCLLLLTFASRANTVHDLDYDTYDEVFGFKVGDKIIKYPTFSSLTSLKDDIKNDRAESILSTKRDSIVEKLQNDLNSFVKEPMVSNTEGRFYYPGAPEDFVRKLHNKLSKKNSTIIHYGDSKTEGDRITGRLRDGLQEMYGGAGPGYFPILQPYSQKSIIIKTTGNWDRYAFFNLQHRRSKKMLPTSQYGIWANVCRFTPAKGYTPSQVKKATISISPSTSSYKRLENYTKFALHYGNCSAKTDIVVYADGVEVSKDTLVCDGSYHSFELSFSSTPKNLKIELSSVNSPDFYGITLDSDGVSVHNVPTRGDTGFFFVDLGDTFDKMSSYIKPDVFIFEFGGNFIPLLKSESQAKANVKRLIDNILWVKKRNKNALFVLIGPSDMLNRSTMTTRPIIPFVVNEMREQALSNGIAFFSMYEAMGGFNSMKIWKEKGYGAGDLIHFTGKGTKKMEDLIFNSLKANLEYIRVKSNMEKEIEEAKKDSLILKKLKKFGKDDTVAN